MSRKTYSLSAAAIAAVASLSFSSVDNAVVFAQEGLAAANPEPVESVQQPIFISEEIVQPIDEINDPAETPVETTVAPQASSLNELVTSIAADDQLSEQMRCLAGAVYFESRGEPLAGQLAVAQVVINRAEDNRWPASYCGVVYQRAQFSFVRGGRMPNVNASSSAWKRAKAVAKIAHEGLWESQAADAVYFHANYVRPSWSRRKTRLAQIDTHIFYR